ncbi:MAG: hypothetical protein ABJA16_10235 [Nakamurella sp.]
MIDSPGPAPAVAAPSAPALGLVTSYGRSGSSRLMQVLKLTGAAAVAGGFPYEIRHAQFGVLCESGAGEIDADGTLTFDTVAYPPPTRRHPDEAETEFRDRAAVAALAGYRRPSATIVNDLIVEKSIGLHIVRQVLGHRSRSFAIVLDRDPRDVFLSILAFNERRGFISFGADGGPEALARNIANYYGQLAALVAAHPERTRIVTYEELIADPEAAAGGAVAAAVHADDAARAAMAIITHPDHVTATDVSASVQRWRSVAADWPAEFERLEQARRDFRMLAGSGAAPGVASGG